MSISSYNYALNAIQWIAVKEDPNDPDSPLLWRYADPLFRAEYPDVLRKIKEAGFSAAMMEVLDTQTLQDYKSMLDASGLAPAPGYLQVRLPSDYDTKLQRGTAEWIHWFDLVRRRAEESNFMGLKTLFVAAEVSWSPDAVRMAQQAAVGADFQQWRLDEAVEILTETAQVLAAEGIHAGLHNHVGTWIETEAEIDYVLNNIDPALMGASFDLGHLEWAGINSTNMVKKWRDRIVDLHIKDLDLDVARDSRENPAPYFQTSDRRIFLEPGLGQIDLIGALSELPQDFGGWIIIEVDRASMDPDESAKVTGQWVANLP